MNKSLIYYLFLGELFLKAAGWKINLGPISFGSGGVKVKPKFDFGFQNDNISIGGGIGDIRDGINVSLEATAKQSYTVRAYTTFILAKSASSTRKLLSSAVRREDRWSLNNKKRTNVLSPFLLLIILTALLFRLRATVSEKS